MKIEDFRKLRAGDTVSIIVASKSVDVIKDCKVVSTYQNCIYVDDGEWSHYVLPDGVFFTHKEAIEEAAVIIKNKIANLMDEVTALENSLEHLEDK